MPHSLLGLLIGLWAIGMAPCAANAGSLQEVEPQMVCMVNNTVFPSPQIPVEVKGKTYFGCCAMCKERLENDAALRHATDPVSGALVDKASAVIGASADGRVQYFENQKNFSQFNQNS